MDKGAPFDEMSPRVRRINTEYQDEYDSLDEKEFQSSPKDGEKLLKASLERRSQNATPIRSNAQHKGGADSMKQQQQLDDDKIPASRMARMKKIRTRRDRITIVQNPVVIDDEQASPARRRSASNQSSPARSQRSGSASSTPRTSPSRKASPGSNRSSPQRSSSAGRHQRVAGGAAAKLIGPKTDEDESEEDEEEVNSYESGSVEEAELNLDIDEYSHLTELDQVRKQTRVEYDIGTEENKRYKLNWDTFDTDEDEKEDMRSEATLPSILNRSEVFHENATAAILALLNPKGSKRPDAVSPSVQSGPISPTSLGGASSSASPSRSMTSGRLSVTSGRLSTTSPRRAAALTPVSKLTPENRDFQPQEVGAVSALDAPDVVKTKVPNQPLLNTTAEQKLELMKKAMIDPSKTLADLLTAIASPPEGEPMDQAYMVRRKNACGALKVLTAKEANRRTIGWTVGVFPALASVLHDGGEGELEETFPDDRIRAEFFEARNRAVSALLNLCLLKENRIPIFHCPGLLHGLAKTIMQDTTEARQGCTAVLGFLAKTPENRLLLVKVPGILDALNNAIKPWSPEGFEDSPERKRHKYVWDSTSGSYSLSSPSQNNSTDKTTDDSVTESSLPNDESITHDDDEESALSPEMTASPTSQSLASRRSFLYDNDPNEFIKGTRQNVFATLLHAVKERDNAFHIARHPDLLFTFVDLSYMHESPSHTHAIQIICNLTRHRGNSKLLVFNNRIVVPALVHAMSSPSVLSRTFACRSLQNLSQDKSCRQDIAITKQLVESLVQRVSLSGNEEEKLAAVSTLKNLADEPTNLIPMTNTPDCFATLMQVAHGQDANTTEMMQFLACDALATLSHWLRKIASTTDSSGATQPVKAGQKGPQLMNPTLQVVTWSQWN